MDQKAIELVSQQIPDLRQSQVKAALKLMDEGDTIPFIARYRKEATGTLDEVQLQNIHDQYRHATTLLDRQQTVINKIKEEGKLTATLEKKILAATELQEVEDLYLPYKQKRQTKAQVARQHGLAPFANWLLSYPDDDPQKAAQKYVNDDVPTVEDVLSGAHEILAEAISEMSTVRGWLRNYTRDHGQLTTTVKRNGEEKDELKTYEQYYDFTSPVNELSSYQILAINRGEKEGVLNVKITADESTVLNYLRFRLVRTSKQNAAVKLIEDAYTDAYKRFLGPAIERELRRSLTESADQQAIKVFGENLYHLLMQAPIKGKVVLGFDPAYRTGCKLAVLDENGKFLTKAVIYPHKPAPEKQRVAAEGQLIDLIEKYHVEMIAIGNGTASRESEQFVVNALKKIKRPVYYVIVNEAGASVYSASQEARDEFPDLHVEQRSAISIGRRLQDPLAELVKIDPQSIGVGQYQHDLPKQELAGELDAVVERAVNRVGVNLNTASYQLLTQISGLNKTTAKNIVKYRDEHGKYTNRQQLKAVPRLGPKAFQQSVGFLRIVNGDNPLDNTDVHPESYPIAKKIMDSAQISVDNLGSAAAEKQLKQLDVNDFTTAKAGVETVKDIVASLQKPGRDLRDSMPAPLLRKDVMTIDDLKPGMKLQGTVRNVVDFGAFVDIGVKHDGLVHVSKMSKEFIKDPRAAVSVGDIVDVWIESVDMKRQRIQLTMIAPQDEAND
ncbi:S1 domain RNA-binding protein [Limosilactobacillus frumenti DSM 13145]|uniref:S1 domain RNA-binding protein n=1 Tax=Limosilactobacillus frumenti DSM 13145 TaxID=1423746 RepID=A0A0R1P8B7_9LACO|nr:Tex family protein [Limosilactobacillus frumenti]KRL28508.1 S1 domain RNA-binding protein [Limosilactobacillus frumenti DSM 13145]MBA2914567.1 RNA-binding transcriptional accessory protein [Limosilactobacillus frumenti]QFG72125.1 RNA-binding transcriptional accessory protein [Limosilactobacillus frumenti]